MAIAKKIEGFITQSSWIRKMFEDGLRLKTQFGEDKVFDFSLGNPNIDTPERFKEMLKDVASRRVPGVHAYMPNAGLYETRKAVADFVGKEHGVPLAAEHIVMACGAGGALNVVFKTLLDPGDEVIFPSPFFVEYRFYVDNHNGLSRPVGTADDFTLDLSAIEEAITGKTKIVMINSPNNPTGTVYDEASIKGLAAILEKKSTQFGKDIYLVSDEPYRDIVYDGVTVPSVLAAYRNSMVATSYSKNLSIPGERIGYLAVSPDIAGLKMLMEGFGLSTRILGFVNAPALMQRVIQAIQGERVEVEIYRKKRDLFCDGLMSIGYELDKPQGAFYLFPKTPIDDDVAFVKALQGKNILTVPGSGFGRAGHFRIAYCVDDRAIINSMSGFREVFEAYR